MEAAFFSGGVWVPSAGPAWTGWTGQRYPRLAGKRKEEFSLGRVCRKHAALLVFKWVSFTLGEAKWGKQRD